MRSKVLTNFLRPSLYWLRSRPAAYVGSAGDRETLYQNVFQRDLARLGIEDEFYPFGDAANYCLMYLLLRAVNELPVTNIVEFGTGQTTILLDRIAASVMDAADGRDLNITSYEHDASWADRIGSNVSHSVVHAPLVSQQVAGKQCRFYDPDAMPDEAEFDLLLIDGPIGSMYRSRWGALGYIEEHVGDDFVIIFDDADRFGEVSTINQCRKILQEKNIEFHEARYRSDKEQHVFCSPSLSAARFF